jgi:predicted  nucleic acid-binding Zn-ribbon protein
VLKPEKEKEIFDSLVTDGHVEAAMLIKQHIEWLKHQMSVRDDIDDHQTQEIKELREKVRVLTHLLDTADQALDELVDIIEDPGARKEIDSFTAQIAKDVLFKIRSKFNKDKT